MQLNAVHTVQTRQCIACSIYLWGEFPAGGTDDSIATFNQRQQKRGVAILRRPQKTIGNAMPLRNGLVRRVVQGLCVQLDLELIDQRYVEERKFFFQKIFRKRYELGPISGRIAGQMGFKNRGVIRMIRGFEGQSTMVAFFQKTTARAEYDPVTRGATG